ncbi:hypothetical protein FQA39_LY17145 [Lamprigera yunnana]|nr:hypothetical protein FQA39_LY17145 [Lamprigera yunnana]
MVHEWRTSRGANNVGDDDDVGICTGENLMFEVRLRFGEIEFILKCYWKTENIGEVQRHSTRKFEQVHLQLLVCEITLRQRKLFKMFITITLEDNEHLPVPQENGFNNLLEKLFYKWRLLKLNPSHLETCLGGIRAYPFNLKDNIPCCKLIVDCSYCQRRLTVNCNNYVGETFQQPWCSPILPKPEYVYSQPLEVKPTVTGQTINNCCHIKCNNCIQGQVPPPTNVKPEEPTKGCPQFNWNNCVHNQLTEMKCIIPQPIKLNCIPTTPKPTIVIVNRTMEENLQLPKIIKPVGVDCCQNLYSTKRIIPHQLPWQPIKPICTNCFPTTPTSTIVKVNTGAEQNLQLPTIIKPAKQNPVGVNCCQDVYSTERPVFKQPLIPNCFNCMQRTSVKFPNYFPVYVPVIVPVPCHPICFGNVQCCNRYK